MERHIIILDPGTDSEMLVPEIFSSANDARVYGNMQLPRSMPYVIWELTLSGVRQRVNVDYSVSLA